MGCKRTFYNVGYALFAVERVYDQTVVYDCGGPKKDSGRIINDAIHRAFPKPEQIDALFISHYDIDHISGIFYLLSHCNVKNIFLPALTDSDKIFLICENDDDSFINFVKNPINSIRGKGYGNVQIIFVQDGEESRYSDEENEYFLNEVKEISDIPSGANVYIDNQRKWVFVPWNIRKFSSDEEQHFIKDIKDKLKAENVLTDSEIDDLSIPDLWNKTESVKSLFKNIIYNHLSISEIKARYIILSEQMTLLS